MDEFQDQFQDMQKKIQALRGKYLFGKNAHDLCLVPSVKIPHKFKVPDFKKYKGAPGHDIENCFALKSKVRRLIQSGILSFENSSPNVQANLLPKHSNATVNMVEGCLGRDPRGYVVVKRDLQEMMDQNIIQVTRDINEDEHEVNVKVPRLNLPEPIVIAYNGQKIVVSPLVIQLAGPMPYKSDKVVPYKYNATMVADGKEVHIPIFPYVVNNADVSGVTQNGRVFTAANPIGSENVVIEKSTQEKTSVIQVGQSNIGNQNVDQDEILKLIKKSDFNVVDQLSDTPSKISVLSLLMTSEAHREALQKVLEKSYMDHDAKIDQFDGIVANITACKNLSFNDEELLDKGRNNNLAMHISMNCQEDALSNVLVDTWSSLNVMRKSTLSKFAYQGAPMRFSGVVVKAFDGSRKTVIGEFDLPIKIAP
ncbi:uncharacterized protein LOC127137625 [Lathyrus oleraceus]|uniref:uncharacterized protein LOC127137625 n=1 Tax=Pisum sativum TaxID=3888 RepID=UPI0021CE02F9|nr:uncharacterized protein LOC127137625 [Pisum sativum]